MMKPLGLNTIREKYLAFFESKGHLRLPSFSLVPRNDPSILLINAGMTPLKPYFTGVETPPALRVTTCQKCIRTPDIERVGKTARHGTFFEMLGNFSFGDYFKKEVIPWAWSFCTEVLEMPPDRLYVSVYEEDDEAFDIWHETVGLSADRIYKMGKEDNFWEHGTGPCGPCSELYFDRGPEHGCGSPDCDVGCDCDRYVEFWNLVFTQFNREEDGTYTPLEKKNIDTGAGLERLASIMQSVDSLFEVDTIKAILDHVCEMAHVTYGQEQKTDSAVRVITDHIRSMTMMISDGIMPSNEGRGYVLRRLIRRAARFGRLLGLEKPFLHEIAPTAIQESSGAYPELLERRALILSIIQQEEKRFSETVQQGMSMLDDLISKTRQSGKSELDGSSIFRLHDTYGFPLDLTREIAAEQGLTLDQRGFQKAMEKQKEKARSALREKAGSAWGQAVLPDSVDRGDKTVFTGYDTLEDAGTIMYLLIPDDNVYRCVSSVESGEAVTVITDRTPFYAASGGQAGDIGEMYGDSGRLTVQDTTISPDGLVLHLCFVEEGVVRQGDRMTQSVDRTARLDTARNHTATHLLHKALRMVLGDHVTQAGSSVTPWRLRFDFTHFKPMTQEEQQSVEDLVNEEILRNDPVITRVMSIEEARREGAMALFDEKYSDQVRVVSVGDFSKELCGGTHLRFTSEACRFYLVSESGIASGTRRIEGLTGTAAWQRGREQKQQLTLLAETLRIKEQDIEPRVTQMIQKMHELEKQQAVQQAKRRSEIAKDLAGQAEMIGDLNCLIASVPADDAAELREIADMVRDRLDHFLVVLAAIAKGKAAWVAMASDEAISIGLKAGDLVRQAARITGGGGGGRPSMAQAGGKDPNRIPEALSAITNTIQEKAARRAK